MSKYDESQIQVLSDIEHIRKRPLMYVSSERPAYQLFTEILDNAIDEAMNGYATQIEIETDFGVSSFLIRDNGRGIPQGKNETLGEPTPVVIYTKLNSGGKYNEEAYSVSSGLHGVGSVVVNALSEEFQVETWRDNSIVNMSFERGNLLFYNTRVRERKDKRSSSGTEVKCTIDLTHKLLSEDSFKNYEEDILSRIKLLKTLFPSITFIYNGSNIKESSFSEFVPSIKSSLFENSIVISSKNLSISFNWNKENNRYSYNSFCNSLYNPQGGDHEKGVADAFSEYFNDRDVLLGFNFAVSCMFPGVEYDSQAKLKAVSSAMRNFVKSKVLDSLKKYFKENPEDKDIILSLIKQKRNDINKRNNKSNVRRDRKSTFLNTLVVSGFADCNTKDRETAELFIVEGNSAAGSAIQARDVNTQAVLPLRGKFINAYTSDTASLLKNAEVATIVSSIDVGIFDDVNIKKSRYGKIIIFTDADEDGKNIAVLLISFFLVTMPELVEAGMLYLALPPLYGTYEGKQFIPINTEEKKNEYLKKGYSITRYKGLGEMNPEQLAIACMNLETRSLIRVDESPECIEEVRKIMGSDTKYRRELLKKEGVLVES